MAGNTRGKLKEHFEGIHRNFDWILYHVNESLKLIAEKHPHLQSGVESIGKAVLALDELSKKIYGKL